MAANGSISSPAAVTPRKARSDAHCESAQGFRARPAAARFATPSPGRRRRLDFDLDIGKGAALQRAATPTRTQADRFVPAREADASGAGAARLELENVGPRRGGGAGAGDGHGFASERAQRQLFRKALCESLLGESPGRRVLRFEDTSATATAADHETQLRRILHERRENPGGGASSSRPLVESSLRVLDAPGMTSDFYLNLLHWSPAGPLAVAIGSALYVYEYDTQAIAASMELGGTIASVHFDPDSASLVAVGLADGEFSIVDVERQRPVWSVRASARATSLAWCHGALYGGFRDGAVRAFDPRSGALEATLRAHSQDVCGLALSGDSGLLASGGNDNLCVVWEPRGARALHVLRHSSAAVKALAWCPQHAHLLAAGGGSLDRRVRVYNAASGALCDEVDTGSQVVGLLWSCAPSGPRELLSAHGFSSNSLALWRASGMARLREFRGHTGRIVSLAHNADRSVVCSLGGDETVRFWRVWEPRAAVALHRSPTRSPARSLTPLDSALR